MTVTIATDGAIKVAAGPGELDASTAPAVQRQFPTR